MIRLLIMVVALLCLTTGAHASMFCRVAFQPTGATSTWSRCELMSIEEMKAFSVKLRSDWDCSMPQSGGADANLSLLVACAHHRNTSLGMLCAIGRLREAE